MSELPMPPDDPQAPTVPHYADDLVTLWHGDCLDVLRTLPDNSVDSVVTDPPAGITFMGKGWDDDKGGREEWVRWFAEVMREALRVTKPGGHAFVWALPRTSHWTACGLEDAGWKIRDCVVHLFGTGFPKSRDVAKAIDKERKEDDVPTRAVAAYLRAGLKASVLTQRQAEELLGLRANSLCNFIQPNRRSFRVPRWELWQQMKAVLDLGGDMDEEVRRLDGRKRQPGEAWQTAELTGFHRGAMNNWKSDGTTGTVDREQKAPNSDVAQQWQGWGTALKPASEHWWLARKPVSSTVACNLAQWGTGAINIDAGRVGGRSGRWPTNAVLDGDHAAEIGPSARSFPTFRYVSKAPASERACVNGVTHPTVKALDLMRWLVRLVTPPEGTLLDPFAGSGSTAVACTVEGFRCIAIEREESYLPLIVDRLSKPTQPDLFGGTA